MKWTAAQDDYLVEHSHKGVDSVRMGMLQVFGVNRSNEAILRHGYRIGVLWDKWTECPNCGQPTRKINSRTGICAACSAKELRDRYRELRKSIEDGDGRAEDYKREYDRDRKYISRHGDFEKLSKRLSNPER